MLRFIQNKTGKCKSINILNIKAYTTYTKKTPIKKITQLQFYKKNPTGNFKNLAKNKKIYEAFEEIREIIKNK
jgi:hypothetical protein